MFCNLAPLALADYDTIGTNVSLLSGASLFREGDPGERVFVLCSGHVKLSCTSREGRTMNLKIASPGDVIGLGAVVSGSPYEVAAQTMDPVSVKIVRRADFLAFLAREGEASLHAAQSLAQEYKTAFSEARRLALSGSVSARLAGILLDWGRAAACGKPEMRFTMALTHDDLASFAATSRETITRTLGKLQKDKVIAVRGSSIHVLSPERLAALAA
jgi:CRP/FNR family transcriptional regulator